MLVARAISCTKPVVFQGSTRWRCLFFLLRLDARWLVAPDREGCDVISIYEAIAK